MDDSFARAARRNATLGLVFVGFLIFFAALFSPVLLSGNYMTGGDGLLQALPTFLGRTPIWEPNMMMGYPLFADPNQAFWYPVLRVLRLVPGSFNAYVLLPYLIGSFGVAGFARRVTGSTAGGIVAGTIVGLGGFMISHQGHLNLIHTAAWAPYVLWTIEDLRRRPRFVVAACGSAAFAMSALAGSQQPLAYVSLIGLAYAVVFTPPAGRRMRYFALVAVLFTFGVGLSAIATIPTLEFTHESARSVQSYAQFIAYSLGPGEMPVRAFFPYFLGATPSSTFPYSHSNVGAFSETTNYAGIFSLMLAIVALARGAERRQIAFWSGVVVWAVWMSVGNSLLGARIAYHIPIYGLFRIPGRHALEFTLGVGMLAAFGVRTLETTTLRSRDVVAAISAVCIAFAAVLGAIAVAGETIRAKVQAATGDVTLPLVPVPLVPWQNPALAIPCLVVLCSCVALYVASRLTNRVLLRVLCVAAITCDMLSFAGSAYWRYTTVAPAVATPPGIAVEIGARANAHGQRMLASTGSRLVQSVPPNLSTLWDVPAAGGYVSLEDRRLADLLEMAPTGEVPQRTFAQDDDRVLDLTATRFILAPPRPVQSVPAPAASGGAELGGFIGADALTHRKSVAFAFPPNAATSIELVSALGLSMTIPDDAHVADIELRDARNRVVTVPILAGRDTSESAYDRPDVRAVVRHRKAHVFATDGTAALYVADFPLPKLRNFRIATVVWRYPDATIGALTISHLALLDERRGIAFPAAAYPPNWIARETSAAETLFENPDALTGAWAVPSAVPLDDASQAVAISEGRIDALDRPFDPRHTALVPSGVSGFDGTAGRADTVRVSTEEPTRSRYEVACVARCFLIVDALWYPGWRATVDGTPTSVTRVDTLLRGIAVTAGRHAVDMWFAPRSLAIGAGVTIVSALVLFAFCFREAEMLRVPRTPDGGQSRPWVL